MTTPYCDKDEWSDREKGITWAAYAVAYKSPVADELDAALEMGARIINKKIGWITSNITDTAYAEQLEDLNYHLANRIMSVKRNRGFEGGGFRFSQQDYLFVIERDDLKLIGKTKGHIKVGRVVF